MRIRLMNILLWTTKERLIVPQFVHISRRATVPFNWILQTSHSYTP